MTGTLNCVSPNLYKVTIEDVIVTGITGGTCAGKTHLAERLIERLAAESISTAYISQDWYYHDLSALPEAKRNETNFDHPDAFDNELFVQHLTKLKRGEAVRAPEYDYVKNIRIDDSQPVSAADVLLVDGLFLLRERAIRDLLDVSVYLSAPDDIRLARRVRRDVAGYDMPLEYVLDQYLTNVKPMHEQFIAPEAGNADMQLGYWHDEDVAQALLTVHKAIMQRRQA